jgi:hypothetical protein
MTQKQGGRGKYNCRRQECQDLPCTSCKDHTFKRTSSELQNLSHTNELMGNDRDTIFAMVCTPSSTRGLILWTGPSSDPLTIEHHQRHLHLVCERKTFALPCRQHRFSGRNTGSNPWHRWVKCCSCNSPPFVYPRIRWHWYQDLAQLCEPVGHTGRVGGGLRIHFGSCWFRLYSRRQRFSIGGTDTPVAIVRITNGSTAARWFKRV